MPTDTDISVFEQHESAARGYCRRFNTLFTQARGSRMLAADGRSYIDFLAGCGALNYGHNDPDMSAALVAHIQRDGLAMGLDLHTDAKRNFLALFTSRLLAPRGLSYRVQFTGPTGTNAVEAAMKLARKVTGRQNIIAFTNGYHGVSMGALAATGSQYNRMGLPLPGVTRMPYDQYFGAQVDTADYLAQMLEDPSSGIDAPAAILLEAVQGEGGLNAARPAWIRRVAEIAQRFGALLIVDDVQAGCGRTGTFFSFEGMAVEPDLVVLSKSISGYGLPMSLLLVRPDRDQWKPAEHNGTFRGNTHAFITAAVAVEKYWTSNWLARQIDRNANTVGAALQDMATLVPGAYCKGRGMMQGLHVGTGALADAICKLCFERGLIIETSGPNDEVVKILAAVNTPSDVLEQGLAILRRSVEDAVRLQPNAAAPVAALALDLQRAVA
ncbi:MAG: diaminobutyrate--2-oxoglutarate transaminase [Aquabacterium sp.]|nr:diaminobutyrate--2-oxoglutarate transaminase [Aquabacterium sp.]